MRYQMRQKLFSWGDDFVIRDEYGQDRFFVDGRVFSIGKQLSFQTMNRQELAFIRQELLSWGPKYDIFRNGQHFATVTKKLFTFLHCTFFIDVPGPDDLVAEGNFTDHEYRFIRQGRVVAGVSKSWFSWTDSYGVDIAPGEDDVLILACTVVIDMACHPDGEDRSLLGSILGS
ncbi:MAG: hypothetical protein GC165_12340 [Armatimonadetes bacterium]|nr:hypothetical protein [Armatimonadota bacterium]